MKKILVSLLTIIFLLSNILFVSSDNLIKKKQKIDSSEKNRVVYENKTVHIYKSNYKKTKLIEDKNLLRFSLVVSELDDEPKTRRSTNHKYELGYLFKALSKKFLIHND